VNVLPRAVEKCVASLIPELKKKHPNASDDDIQSRAFAICTAQYKRNRGEKSDMEQPIERHINKMFYYKSPMERFDRLSEAVSALKESSSAILFGLENSVVQAILMQEAMPSVPNEPNGDVTITGTKISASYDADITPKLSEEISKKDDTHFFIKGEAIHVGITKNQNLYTAKELELAAPTLVGKPIQQDHSMLSIHTVGKVLISSFDKTIGTVTYLGRIRRDHSSEAVKSVAVGDLDTVSIGATAEDVVCSICDKSKVLVGCRHTPGMKYDNILASAVGIGIEFEELSLTPIPADARATAGLVSVTHSNIGNAIMALAESYNATGGSDPMPQNSETKNIDVMKEKDDEIKSLSERLQVQNDLMEQRERKAAAEKVAAMKIVLGLITQNQIDVEIATLMERSVDALQLLEETLSKQVADSRSENSGKGQVMNNDPEPDDFTMSSEEAKVMIAEYLGLPIPTPAAKRAVQENIRFNEYHPNREYYFAESSGGNK